jgi:hypothetical protein
LEKINIFLKPSEVINEEDRFIYSHAIQNLMNDKFSDFGVFRDFEVLIRQAGSFYDETDEITRFFDLMRIDERLKNIIIAKHDIGDIIGLEEKMIDQFNEYQNTFKDFREIHYDEASNFRIKLKYTQGTDHMINTQLLFCKEYEDYDFDTMLKLFYEWDSYTQWIPCVSQSKTVSKCITI